ncbi:hypothetical protein HPG69_015572 [Diceros bicornis minor]|uniref:Deoxyuridine 5'-triphosphate nucleotidohydrolase n=1 Tax=Diceros bicornis minor TaxID=77932 RepID=A0A7J7E760_DICBM|nr:hypothetical protein HPG69_015572 [Diceros bicornis minor]
MEKDGMQLRFNCLLEHAMAPTRGSLRATCYDLYSAYDSTVPREKALMKTDIQMALPSGCYRRVVPHSGLDAKYFIDIGSGVIDEDYRGKYEIQILDDNERGSEELFYLIIISKFERLQVTVIPPNKSKLCPIWRQALRSATRAAFWRKGRGKRRGRAGQSARRNRGHGGVGSGSELTPNEAGEQSGAPCGARADGSSDRAGELPARPGWADPAFKGQGQGGVWQAMQKPSLGTPKTYKIIILLSLFEQEKVSWTASEWKRPWQERVQNRPGPERGGGRAAAGAGPREGGDTDPGRGRRRTHLPSWQS